MARELGEDDPTVSGEVRHGGVIARHGSKTDAGPGHDVDGLGFADVTLEGLRGLVLVDVMALHVSSEVGGGGRGLDGPTPRGSVGGWDHLE